MSLRKGKSLFVKQYSSDELDVSPDRLRSRRPGTRAEEKQKSRLSRILVEIRHQGIVNFLTGENLDEWSKCRLVLVRTAAGHLLEFYTPPKVVKPKSGVFCFLITEARETTALEMPDRENTFVLRAENGVEYVIEANDANDMKAWLSAIRASMRPASTNGLARETNSLPHSATVSDDGLLRSCGDVDPPELPPRLAGRHLDPFHQSQLLSSPSGPDITPAEQDGGASGGSVDAYGELHSYPWFHGTLARSEAAQLVLQEGQAGHGTFLVRQSETRVGDYVLTFNYQGRPKHVRLTISKERQCRVQHLWFNSIFTMLEHFRTHPIPLESGGSSDVTLGEFVLVPRRPAEPGSLERDPRARPVPTVPDVTEVRTFGGSVRIRTSSLERIEQQTAASKRAVDNTYAFF